MVFFCPFCINRLFGTLNLPFKKEHFIFLVNKAWNLPQMEQKNKSYLCLEESYWIRFWDKVLSFCMKSLLEVPCHQYGNIAAGVFLLWPPSYHCRILQLLKLSAESNDITPSGINVVKSVLNYLLAHNIQESWDKSMSSALSMFHNQYSMPVLVAENKIRTKTGNALCICLESFGTTFLNGTIITGNIFLKLFHQIQITLDCLVSFSSIKIRASVSSNDMTCFLLISCSDCVHALDLISNKAPSCSFVLCMNMKSVLSHHWKICISKQIEILSGHITEAPFIIHKVICNIVKHTSRNKLKKSRWRIYNYDNSCQLEMFTPNSIDDTIKLFTDIIHHIHGGIDILYSIVSAIALSLISFLQGMYKNFSNKKIQVVKEVLADFLKWLETLNIEESDREKLKEIRCLKKLLYIVQILESSTRKPKYFQRFANKVSPLVTDVSPNEYMILTEEEQLYWQMCCRRSILPCS